MMYCSLTLMIFTHLKNNNNNGHSSTSNPGVAEVKKENLQEFFSYTAFLFVSLIIGKRTSNYIMKRILASGGFYKLKVSASSTESKSSPNSAVVIASSEYWWNLTECLLITTFLEDPLEIYFLHGLFIVECALHYWDIRGQRMQYKHQRELIMSNISSITIIHLSNSVYVVSPVNYSPEATKSSPVTSSNTEPPSNNSANGTRSNIPTTRSNYELSSEWRGSGKQPARSTSSDDLYNSNDDLTARKRRMGSINLKQIPSFSSLTDLNSPGTSSYSSPGVVAAQGSISNLYPGEMPATPTRRKMMAAELLNLGSPLAESLLTSYTFAVVRLFGLAQISLFHFTVSSLNSRYIRTISIPQLSLMTVLNIMFILVVSRLAAARNVKITTNFINMTYLAMGSWISLMIASMGWLTLWFVTHGGSLV